MIEAESLKRSAGVRHGFFTRAGGVSEGLYASLNCGIGSHDSRADVERNRAIVAEAIGTNPEKLINPYQIHSATAVIVETPWAADSRPKADALVTARAGLGLAISTADCAPVLFADSTAGVIGAAHAGWRGALGGVLEATIDAMLALGAERGRIAAAIGPAISKDAYEVGPDFIEKFNEENPSAAVFLHPAERPGHALFDLPAYAADRLRKAGIASVETIDLCTYRNEAQCFSYRRATHRGEADYGRHFSAIVLT